MKGYRRWYVGTKTEGHLLRNFPVLYEKDTTVESDSKQKGWCHDHGDDGTGRNRAQKYKTNISSHTLYLELISDKDNTSRVIYILFQFISRILINYKIEWRWENVFPQEKKCPIFISVL